MAPGYRVRYSSTGKAGQQRATDVQSLDVRADLDHLLEHLPAGAYILSIEDLADGRTVHWTRWPAAYRPGLGG